jgi:hypothetical protein
LRRSARVGTDGGDHPRPCLAVAKEPASIARYLATTGAPIEVPRRSPGRGPIAVLVMKVAREFLERSILFLVSLKRRAREVCRLWPTLRGLSPEGSPSLDRRLGQLLDGSTNPAFVRPRGLE